MIVQVTESQSKHGHPIIEFSGPLHWARLYISSARIIQRRGVHPSAEERHLDKELVRLASGGDMPNLSSIHALDELEKVKESARRYARKRR